ncbi:polyribonucleotide nucleotidyltransferase [Candidatus Saccharibacteria bacterium]|nr:polyribonucleotide nucleotidyltransferase [Candidatus Saccharibacteria bacterium]MDQ5885107.1 polyribonucleotide nucleotidyltransferase [Patescibacteria group bacterium]MDQ5958443.1 polyribonucleotide nucleotidyltransferase [Patescibacteria group bacterium]
MGDIINPYNKPLITVETEFFGRTLSLEINRVGFRSSASVLVRYGETVVLGTAMVSPERLSHFDYFPLSIDYEEKMYAAGKVSGSRFIKREGRPSDDAILIGRLIDRPIRPLWPKGYRHEVQGVATVLSMDPAFRPDMIAMIAMSTAFSLTGAPFDGPVAGLRVAQKEDGSFTAFAEAEVYNEGVLDLVVAGTKNGVMMVEAGASEVSEETISSAIAWAYEAMQPAIDLQKQLVEKVGVKELEYELDLPKDEIQQAVDKWVEGKFGENLRAPYPERNDLVYELRSEFHNAMEDMVGEDSYKDLKSEYDNAFTLALHKDVRKGIVEESVRPDGRGLTDIRPLSSQVGILPRVHGSSIFTRGVTQALNVVTLAPLSYSQMVDTMERSGERRYIHHYNAPGYTVGEVKRLGSPGRREIGHGYLAERAITAVLPNETDFPYMIRSVTEIMSQNGSTSMAATCSSCLALMDAGVPLKRPVSGIAMGLMMDGDRPIILSDIADAEDFAGDMDFKVTGTTNGITALQMDMKVHGLPVEVLTQALAQSKAGRAHILEHMVSIMPEPNKNLSPYAPRVESIQINPDKIRDVIGKGGEMINKIIAETGAEIDIKDDGTVFIASPDGASIERTIKIIKDLTTEPEVGKIYEGTVAKVMDFGAFVTIMPGTDGMVHVSEMSDTRVNHPSDVVKEGDKVTVKLVAIDDRGRLNLSMKKAKQ